jgi:hypothetical protein
MAEQLALFATVPEGRPGPWPMLRPRYVQGVLEFRPREQLEIRLPGTKPRPR